MMLAMGFLLGADRPGTGAPAYDRYSLSRAHPVELSRWRVAEAAQLREDELHPVAALPASLQFLQGRREHWGLRGHEAVQVEGISIRHHRHFLFRTPSARHRRSDPFFL